MTPVITLRMIALGGIAATALTISQGFAQTTITHMSGFSGSTPSSVAGCPYIIWRLANDPNGRVHGIAYYSDLSGLSTVMGERNADGNFTLSLTPSSIGAGPSGTASGKVFRDGAVDVKMTGQGCANMDHTIKPVRNMDSIGG
jgi:hypothetical protein